nr:MAG TPA: hypothetical protein [Caudoviricetes sp.]
MSNSPPLFFVIKRIMYVNVSKIVLNYYTLNNHVKI